MNFLDLFACVLREKREFMKVTQRDLADKLGMCNRKIMEIEGCKSSPRFETVALIAREMNISLDSVVFHDTPPQEIPKCVSDYFAGKSEAEAQRYIALCQNAENLRDDK